MSRPASAAQHGPFSVRRISRGADLHELENIISRDVFLILHLGILLFCSCSFLLILIHRTSFEMSNIVASSIAILCGCAATYYSNDSSATFSYLKAAALSASIYLPLQFIWSCFLYPLYFSPLRKLPQAPVRFPNDKVDTGSDSSTANWRMEKLLHHNEPSSGLGIHGHCAT